MRKRGRRNCSREEGLWASSTGGPAARKAELIETACDTPAVTRTQIDKLGDRLRSGSFEDDDLYALEEYRGSFRSALHEVMAFLREIKLTPTGREKTKESIVQKLQRESIRLSQIQDIAGCRVVVP